MSENCKLTLDPKSRSIVLTWMEKFEEGIGN